MEALNLRRQPIGPNYANPKFDAGWNLSFKGEAKRTPAETGRVTAFGPRASILEEGDLTSAVHEIIEGSVLLFKLLPDGRRQIIEVLGAGDVFGLSPSGVADVGAEALTKARIAIHDKRRFDSDPELRTRVFERLRRQLCMLHDHALLLGRKSAQERVATFIMRLVPDRGGRSCHGPSDVSDSAKVDLPMTRQEIADYLGLTIETVSRSFSALKRGGVVAYERQDSVTIPQVCRLCRMTGSH
ncbi:MAG: transcriptional regulator [Salinarimonadaceae bacterium]|nr:MAG: transcriptional regulator [Salinarimonadaceae bacterium]